MKMQNNVSNIKNTLEAIKSRMDGSEERISDFEDKVEIPNQNRKWGENKKKEDSLSELWDNMRCINIHITGIPEGSEDELGTENLFKEIITETW